MRGGAPLQRVQAQIRHKQVLHTGGTPIYSPAAAGSLSSPLLRLTVQRVRRVCYVAYQSLLTNLSDIALATSDHGRAIGPVFMIKDVRQRDRHRNLLLERRRIDWEMGAAYGTSEDPESGAPTLDEKLSNPNS